jgi:general secretion pathway protein M
MLDQLNKQQKRWVALGLLGIIILFVVLIVIVPLINAGLDYNETKQDLAFRLKRYKEVIASKDKVMANAENVKKQYAEQEYFNTRETEALASAALQKFIKTAISAAGGQLTSTQVLPSKTEEDITRITVKVRMNGTIEHLRRVLYDIEMSKPLMLVEEMDIRPVRGRRNRKTRKIEPSNKMNVNFQVVSFMRIKS